MDTPVSLNSNIAGRPHLRPLGAVALAVLVLGTLSGCITAPASPPTPSPPATANAPHLTPLFATDNQALVVATDAYAAYLKVSDEVLAQGGADSGRLRAVATGQALDQLEKGASTYARRGWSISGDTMFDSLKVQGTSTFTITVYVCEDVSNVAVVDASGISQLSGDRQTRTPFLAQLVQRGQRFVLASKTRWTGSDFCA